MATSFGGWPARSLDARIPLAVLVALLLGAAGALQISLALTPSASVGGSGGSSYYEQLDLRFVTVFFGAPIAAAAAAIAATSGGRFARPNVGALAGAVLGIGAFAGIGAASHALGTWWIQSVPTDTNRAAAELAAFLVPPGALALLLTVRTGAGLPGLSRRAARLHSLISGTVVGLVLGGFIGGTSAVVTLASSCDYAVQTCLVLSSVMDSGSIVGGLVGLPVGAILGWLVSATWAGGPSIASVSPTSA